MFKRIRAWFKPNRLLIDWESLPEWANWVAMDKIKYDECEIVCYERDNKKLMANWQKSLQQRSARSK